MPRTRRVESPSGVYHFINRGVNKKALFHKKEDYYFFLDLVKEYSSILNIQVYHYCLMGNHTHFLINADNVGLLSRFAHFIQRRYAYYYCKTYKWSEQVFRKRFLSIPVKDDIYLLECGRYIERNPLEAKVAQKPDEYAYSSYGFYAHNKPNPMLTHSPAYLDLATTNNKRMDAYKLYVCHNRYTEDKLPF